MEPLPEPQPHPTGQRPADDDARDRAEQIVAAVEEALADAPTRYRDDTPLPEYGDTPPVPQPGRPPMSQAAADASGLMLAAGAGSLGVGGAVSLVLWASGYADPTVIALVGGAPVALVLAIGRLVRHAKPAPDVHHHYDGPVHQENTTTNHNRWWGKSTTSS